MDSVLVIVVLLAIMATIVGGTWFWLSRAVKDNPGDLPVLGDHSARPKVAEKK